MRAFDPPSGAATILSVGELSRQEVARRAGVDAAYVDRLVELGILKADAGAETDLLSAGDVRRVRYIRGLEQSGVPLEELAVVVRDGALSFSYLDMSAYDRFTEVSGGTFGELSAKTGLSMELLAVVREAMGLAEPRPEDRAREDELAVAEAVAFQVSKGVHPVAIERWLRVCADGLRRIAETEADWYKTEIMDPMLEAGLTEAQMMEAQAELGSQMAPLVEEAVRAIYHGQQEHAWTKAAVESVEDVLERAGLMSRVHHPPAVCFLDVTGYTRLTEERGDEAAADLAARLATLVRRSSQEHHGQAVKWLGDGVMFVFPNPAQSVLAALDMVEDLSSHDLPPAHVGIHTGPVVFQEGDYYGRTVNIASRIAEYARPGEVLVSEDVVNAAHGTPVAFTEVGPIELRGVSGAIRVHTAKRAA
jgi:adenylate cyclase